MTAQESKERNWLKFRLLGLLGLEFTHKHTALMTAEEAQLLQELMAARSKLLYDWDVNSIRLGLKLKPYKCSACGRRSNKSYEFREGNYCKKHYEEYLKEEDNYLKETEKDG